MRPNSFGMSGATASDGGASTSGLEDDFRNMSVAGERATRGHGARLAGSSAKLDGMDDVLDSLR